MATQTRRKIDAMVKVKIAVARRGNRQASA